MGGETGRPGLGNFMQCKVYLLALLSSALLSLADVLPPHRGRASHLSVSVALAQHEGWGEAGAMPCVSLTA